MNGNSSNLQRLKVPQNRALHIVLGVEAQYTGDTLYSTLKVDRLIERWQRQSLIFIYKAIHNLLPESLCSRIELRETTYNFQNTDGSGFQLAYIWPFFQPFHLLSATE